MLWFAAVDVGVRRAMRRGAARVLRDVVGIGRGHERRRPWAESPGQSAVQGLP